MTTISALMLSLNIQELVMQLLLKMSLSNIRKKGVCINVIQIPCESGTIMSSNEEWERLFYISVFKTLNPSAAE